MDRFFGQVQKDPPKPKLDIPSQLRDSPSEDDGKQAVASTGGEDAPKKLPNGVVLGKDGKPCRSCTSFASWVAMTKKQTANSSTSETTPSSKTTSAAVADESPPADCPPDVDVLGRSTWTLLHSISASYPPAASPAQQAEMKQFLGIFGRLYPCWVCAEDFQAWMQREEPVVDGRAGLGDWMCRAHNEVNRKLGKEEFDCRRWEERWRTGWRDGRCG